VTKNLATDLRYVAGVRGYLFFRKYSIVFIGEKFCALPLSFFSTFAGVNYIFPIQGLRIWLLIRSISPVFAETYFAKILQFFYRKKICALPLATISTFAGVNYIPHSVTKNLATDFTAGISLSSSLVPKIPSSKMFLSPPPPLINAPFSAVSAHH
jgi:hypothetical protein